MLDPEILKWFASLGVGGVLAGVIFLAYRQDVMKRSRALEADRAALLEVVARTATAMERLIASIEAHALHESGSLSRLEQSAREIGHDVKNVLVRSLNRERLREP